VCTLRIAIVSDIHGNWTALQAVIQQLDQLRIDAVLGAGDYLWTTAGDRPVVDWLQHVPNGYFVRGNGECWAYYEKHKDLALTDPYPLYQVLTALPERLVLDWAGYRILLQHEWWPDDRDETVTNLPARISQPPYVSPSVDLTGIDIAVFGDSHLPLHHATPDTLIVHPGSVGAPFDADPTSAKFALLELLPDEVRLTHLAAPFDIDAANREILAGRSRDNGHSYYRKMTEFRLKIASPHGEYWAPTPEPVRWRKGVGALAAG
jgi:predicted phosphodiesterase